MNQTIGTDYSATQNTLKKMNENVVTIANETKKLVELVTNAKDWVGPDAAIYKERMYKFAQGIAAAVEVMEQINNTLSEESTSYYNRSVEDAQKASKLAY